MEYLNPINIDCFFIENKAKCLAMQGMDLPRVVRISVKHINRKFVIRIIKYFVSVIIKNK